MILYEQVLGKKKKAAFKLEETSRTALREGQPSAATSWGDGSERKKASIGRHEHRL